MRRCFPLALLFAGLFFAFHGVLIAEEQSPKGAALSGTVSSKLAAAGFAQEFLFATGENDGFPYTITVTFPAARENGEDARQIIDTLVIAAAQDISYIDPLIEFMETISKRELAINVCFVFTANDVSAVDGSWTLCGTKRFVETIEDTDSVCALLLMPDETLDDSSARIVHVSTLADNVTLTPLWLAKALAFKSRFPSYLYRLNLINPDGRLSFFALNEIASAGIAFNPLAPATLFDGLSQFIDLMSSPEPEAAPGRIDFSQTEGNYLSIPYMLGETVFFIRERAYLGIFLLCIIVLLIILCIFPSIFTAASFVSLLLSSIDPSFLVPAAFMCFFLMLAQISRKKIIRFIFASFAPCIFLLCAMRIILIPRVSRITEKNQIMQPDSVQVSLEASRMNFIEHELVIITASADLPIIRCDISVATSDINPLYSSIFPVTFDADFTASFELEEYPPNPLVMQYLTSKDQEAALTADFFLDAGDGAIFTKRVQKELRSEPVKNTGG